MANPLHRLLTYLANELIVERLSNNRLFQQFVVKSNAKFKEGTTKIKAKAEDWTSPTSSPSAQQMHARLHNTTSSLGSFGTAFFKPASLTATVFLLRSVHLFFPCALLFPSALICCSFPSTSILSLYYKKYFTIIKLPQIFLTCWTCSRKFLGQKNWALRC